MSTKDQDQFAQEAVTVAIRAAGEYLRAHNLKADNEALAACLRSWVKIKLPEALRDCKEAFDCGMTQIGIATFKASLAQAGIEAAKECGMPV